MFKDEGDFHASTFILAPHDQVVLVRDTRKQPPLWKFAGGKKRLLIDFFGRQRDERPVEAAIRETKEETGLVLKKGNVTHIHSVNKGHYNKHVFFSRVYSLRKLRALSPEYEETRVFSLPELEDLQDWHPEYRMWYEKYIKPLIITPRGKHK